MFETTAPWQSFQNLLRAYWKLITVFAVFGGLLGALFLSQTTPAYRATAEVVTGTYSLPAEVGTEPAVDKAGPLGLELPAETQARIIASPAVADIASLELGLDERQAAELPHQITADPTTDNTFAVRVEGTTPEVAADRANAVANAYLQYRKETGKQELESLAVRANELASDNIEAARALDGPIDAEVKAGNSAFASVMLSRRQELERTAATASASAAAFGSASERFDGGGSVLNPASSRTVANVLPPANVMIFGVLAGTVAGIALAAVRRQFGNVKVRVDDIRRAAPEVYAIGNKDKQQSMQLMLRSVARAAEDREVDSSRIIVRPLGESASYGRVLLALMEDSTRMGRNTVLSTEDPAIWAALNHLRSEAPPGWAWKGSKSGGVVESDPAAAPASSLATPDTPIFSILVLPGGRGKTAWYLQDENGAATVLLLRQRKERIRDFQDIVRDHAAAGIPVAGVIVVDESEEHSGRTAVHGHVPADTRGQHSSASEPDRLDVKESSHTGRHGEMATAAPTQGSRRKQ